VKRTRSILFPDLFMWVVILAATFILLWGMDELRMVVVAILGTGTGSHMAVSNGLRNFQLSTCDP
jgi:hypothetical protein